MWPGLIKSAVFLLCLAPALWLGHAVYLAWSGGPNLLGPDPAQFLALETGQWSIRLLVAALAVTPLRHLLAAPRIWQYRRMIGLFALFYVSLHFLVFLAFLLQWEWADFGREIAERPYITVGFAAFVLLLPLGLTSVQIAQRKMGRRWKQLHRLVYVINILAVLHILWVLRSSYADVVLYGGLVAVLLLYRWLRHASPRVRRFSLSVKPLTPFRSL
jgi:sulfoxide reductase heme-binding subunit YedZ